MRKAALLGAIPPFLLKTDDNPEGVDGKVFDGIKAAIVNDRYAYFEDFLNNFYNVDVLGGTRISDRAWQASFNVAAGASPFATYACVDTWLTDFRADLPKIDVPVLVVHGTEDRILPFDSTAARLPGADRRPDARPGRGRPAQHRLDAPRRGQRRAARVPRRGRRATRRARPRPGGRGAGDELEPQERRSGTRSKRRRVSRQFFQLLWQPAEWAVKGSNLRPWD